MSEKQYQKLIIDADAGVVRRQQESPSVHV
jgi:hypothetical protein